MGVLAVIHVQAQPGKGGDLAKALERPMGVTKHNPDCPSIELYTSVADPERLVLIEEWSSEEAHHRHVEKPDRERRSRCCRCPICVATAKRALSATHLNSGCAITSGSEVSSIRPRLQDQVRSQRLAHGDN